MVVGAMKMARIVRANMGTPGRVVASRLDGHEGFH